MKKIIDIISEEVKNAFEEAGYDRELGKVTLSNRPDLCEFQCNGAMAAAKKYKKAPLMISDAAAGRLEGNGKFSEVSSVKPGFLNLTLSEEFLAEYLSGMQSDERYGSEKVIEPKKIIIDYGGANAAKPLHVGHLRSAVIGECLKRICRYMGNDVLGDVHLGDWGLQMGLIITELKERKPDLPYFDESFEGEYPAAAPFTISELEEIYPSASKRSKEDEEYKKAALKATFELQQGRRGYRALWQHIIGVSVTDLKKNYGNLGVEFDLWKGESDAQEFIAPMVQKLKDDGYAYMSEGALVVDVSEESDAKEVPPCIILKSDGAALYSTTDLATIVWRVRDYDPDEIIYLADKRQDLHFKQVFRCAKKTGIAGEDTELKFIGFGTMNGKDGKPFKTRDGGVMRLEVLINDIVDEMSAKINESDVVEDKDAQETARMVALSAIKYGDLSNQASKDYIFDIERFISFEGNTGPYILYTIVRIKSIMRKYREAGYSFENGKINPANSEAEKALMLEAAKFSAVIESAYEELAPHRICSYIYDLANAFNRFYHSTKILSEPDENIRSGYIRLLQLICGILETCIDLLGFEAPERM